MDLLSRRWRVAACGVALAVGAVVIAPVPASGSDEEQELAETRRRERDARSRLGELEQSDVELAAAIDTATRELDAAVAELGDAEAAVAAAENRLELGRYELAEAERVVSVAEGELRRRAARAYAQPRLVPDSAIIAAEDPLELAKRTALADAVLDGDSQAVVELDAARQTQADMVVALDVAAADAALARAAAAEQRDQVAARRAELDAARQELQRRLEATHAEVEALQAQEQELVAIIRRREEEARRAAEAARAQQAQQAQQVESVQSSSPGRLLWPSDGWVSSEFGPRWGRNHNGIDIAAPTGTTVRAAAGGVVYHAGPLGSFGNLVALDHGGGMTTLYAHLSTVEVWVGQWVSAGERVAGVGSTGRSTGPHLHFEVRIGGVAANPRGYLG